MRSAHQQFIPAFRRLVWAETSVTDSCFSALSGKVVTHWEIGQEGVNWLGLMSATENISQDSVRDVSWPSSADKKSLLLTSIFQTSFKSCALGKYMQQRQPCEESSPEGLYPAQTRSLVALIHVIKLSKCSIPRWSFTKPELRMDGKYCSLLQNKPNQDATCSLMWLGKDFQLLDITKRYKTELHY